jgi:hypothetical protein
MEKEGLNPELVDVTLFFVGSTINGVNGWGVG